MEDVTDFDDSGQLEVDGEVVAYSAIDETANTISISPLVGAHTADTFVYHYPQTIDRVAWLVASDSPDGEEGMMARVPHALWDRLAIGARDIAAGEGETVSAEFVGDELVVTDVLSREPVVDASFIDTTTFTAPPSDGSPPAASPTPTVIGGPSFIAARWTAATNVDPVTYEVHVSTSTGFTPDATTLYSQTFSTAAIIKTLANGTALAYATTYYVKLVAKDTDGSAAAGAQGSGAMVKIQTVEVNTDGASPSTPSAPTIVAGPGWIQAKWSAPTGTSDPLTYKVYARAGSDPTVSDDTYTVGTTTALSFVISKLADGTALAPGTTYYIKVRAISTLSANASAASSTGTGSPSTIPSSGLTSDGAAPGSSPTPAVKGGPSLLAISWAPVTNNDSVSYEVHLSTSTGFTPGGGTLLGTTLGESWVTTVTAAGAALTNATTYYVKIIAKDVDGSAAASSQGSAAPLNLASSAQTTDGAAPSAVGSAPTIQGGVGYLAAFWSPVTNNDPVSYEVHVSTSTGFTPGAGTLYLTTPGSSAIIRKMPDASALAYATTYYVKIIAKDADGSAAASSQGSGSMVQAVGGSGNDIAATTITAANIAANTITAGQIVAGTITATEIAAATITGAKIAATTITASNIAANTITAGQITAGTITATEIAAATITGAKIAATTITAANITAATITTTEIAANTIVAGNIAAATITGAKIAATTITAGNIAANTITASQIAAGTITATEIAAATITGAKIAATTITASNIVANTITASQIAANTLTATEIAADAITASELAAASVTAAKLESSLVLSTKIVAGTVGAARIELGLATAGTGLYAYASDGTTVKFSVGADTGNVYAAGRIDFGAGSRLDSDIVELAELPSAGYQTPSLVQSAQSGGYTLTSITCQWLSATTVGNCLLMVVAISDADATAPTPTTPTGWSLVESRLNNAGGSYGQALFVYRNTTGARRSGPETITLNDTVDASVSMFEFAGVQVAAADQTNKSSGSSTTADSGTTSTTAQTDELWFGVLMNESTPFVTVNQSSPTNSFSLLLRTYGGDGFTGHSHQQYVYTKNVTSTGAANVAATLSASVKWAGVMVALKAKTALVTAPAANKVRLYALDDGHASTNNNASFLVTQNELGVEKSLEFPGLTKFHDATAPSFFYVHSDFAEAGSVSTSQVAFGEGVVTSFSGTATSAVQQQAATGGHVGIVRIDTGSTNAGASSIRSNHWNLDPGGGRMRMGALVRIPTLSDGTNTFYAGVGFKNFDGSWNNLVTGGNAILFRYSSANNSGKWQASACDGTANSGDTGITVNANQWYWLEIDVSADGSEAKFYVDGALKTTLGANIPTGPVGHHVAGINKTVGTTARSIDVDFYYCYWEHGTRSSS